MENFNTPKDLPWLTSSVKKLFPIILDFKHPGMLVQIIGNGLERFKLLAGQRTVICPNHPEHSDPEVLFEFSRLVGEDFNYLAARELFHANHGLNEILQYFGCYSVARGAKDFEAIEVTRDLIIQGQKKVVIFPEGEVSHQNDGLLPLKSGAIHISFSALEYLKQSGEIVPVTILPLAIKYTYGYDAKWSIEDRLWRLEARLGIKRKESSLLQRLHVLLSQKLSDLEIEYHLQQDHSLPLEHRLNTLRACILEKTSSKLAEVMPADISQLDYAHHLQSVLYRQVLEKQSLHIGKGHVQRKRRKLLQSIKADLYRAINLIGVSEHLLSDAMTQEQFADKLSVLEYDTFASKYDNDRTRVLINVGNPIDLLAYLGTYEQSRATAIGQVTDLLACELSLMLKQIDENRQPIILISD